MAGIEDDSARRLLSRRGALSLLGAACGGAAAAQEAPIDWDSMTVVQPARAEMSAFRLLDWRDHFTSLRNGAILVDIESRALQFWSEDRRVYRLFPTSVPASEDLTRRGRTRVIDMVTGPDWRPTPAMLARHPDWPPYVPPGPDNPLGSHALYLTWTYYRIHGTHDRRKIGRMASNGCIGLYNEHIAELYRHVRIGTQVVIA